MGNEGIALRNVRVCYAAWCYYTDYFKNRDFVHQIGFYSPDGEQFVREHNRLFLYVKPLLTWR